MVGAIHKYRDMRFDEFHLHLYLYGVHHYLQKDDGKIKPFNGETNIFIKPGWKINSIDGIITNFHLPKSTLLLLIYALIGKKKTMKLYNFAIQNKLRFFSYGDASLIWRKNGKF